MTEAKSGPAFQQVPGSALVAVMRRDGAKAADYARRHNVPRWYDDANRLIADPEVNAVYIATPPGSHCDYALRVAAAGKPCYVEKPMARNAAECRRMTDAFDAAGVPLFVAYYRRCLPDFVRARQLIADSALGTLSQVAYRFASASHRQPPEKIGWRIDPETAGGGIFLDLASHLLDALDYILGPLENVAGFAANAGCTYAVEDTVAMTFTAPGQRGPIPGVATWNFASDIAEDRIEITGTDGRLSWPCFGGTALTLQRGSQTETITTGATRHVQLPLIERIVAQLQGGPPAPSTGHTALRTSRVMDTVLAEYYRGREDAFWLRDDWKPAAG